MLTDRIKELEETRSKLAELEAQVAAESHKELAALPARYGFDSTAAFIAAVRAASEKRRGRKPGSKAKVPKAAKAGKRTRATITDATRAEVKKLVEAGKTCGEIAKTLKISLPSVQNIKKALGLVRKKK